MKNFIVIVQRGGLRGYHVWISRVAFLIPQCTHVSVLTLPCVVERLISHAVFLIPAVAITAC